jgi:transcriptional regulator with GAF, ATPase, and Fis domain
VSEARSVDPDAVARSVADLRADDLGKGELRAALNAVVEASAAVFAADGAGVMLIDDQQALHYVGATDGRAAALEAAQEETGEGPCIDSLVNDTLVFTSDLIADDRWPHLTQQIGSLGVRAIVGAPLRLGMGAIGSLNVYRFEPWAWDEADLDGVQAYAQVVEELLGSAILARERHTIVDQLSRALENRVMIERAVGVLMATEGLDAVRAFDALRRAARSRRVRVSALAEEMLSARRFSPETDGSGTR